MPSAKAPSSSAGATATDLRKPEHVGEPQPDEADVALLERASTNSCCLPMPTVWPTQCFSRVTVGRLWHRARMDDYRALNRGFWDDRAPAHAASNDYAFARFVQDPGFLSHVVRFDAPRLGDLTGLRGVHLQCHVGTDTISLERLGAVMTGVDFSPVALAEARTLPNDRLRGRLRRVGRVRGPATLG